MGGRSSWVKAVGKFFTMKCDNGAMGMMQKIAGTDEPASNTATSIRLHALRSQLTDAFAGLETVVLAKCREAGISVAGVAPLSQKLNKLAKAEFANKVHAASAIGQCAALLDVRNDLVHGQLVVVWPDASALGQPWAVFRNIGSDGEAGQYRRTVMTSADMRSLLSQIAKLGKKLSAQPIKAKGQSTTAAANGPASAC